MAKPKGGAKDKKGTDRSADIFDRSFKQIISSLSPGAMIRFINGLFGCDYPPDSEVRHLNAEQIGTGLDKRLPDEVVSVAGRTYIIEEQTADDANMAVRVFEYGFAQALKEKEAKDGVITLPFPRAAVIYLEAGGGTPDTLEIRVKFPGGETGRYAIETVKLLEHSIEEIAGRGLSALLPFYIVKLRKPAKRAKTAEERAEVEAGFRELAVRLKEAIEGGLEKGEFSEEDAGNLLERLAGLVQYVGRGYKTTEVKDMLSERYMGYATRMRLKGERKGERKGKLEGEAERRRLEQEVEQRKLEGEAERRRLEQEVEQLKREIEKLSRNQGTA
jgi:hypothetical protein